MNSIEFEIMIDGEFYASCSTINSVMHYVLDAEEVTIIVKEIKNQNSL